MGSVAIGWGVGLEAMLHVTMRDCDCRHLGRLSRDQQLSALLAGLWFEGWLCLARPSPPSFKTMRLPYLPSFLGRKLCLSAHLLQMQTSLSDLRERTRWDLSCGKGTTDNLAPILLSQVYLPHTNVPVAVINKTVPCFTPSWL